MITILFFLCIVSRLFAPVPVVIQGHLERNREYTKYLIREKQEQAFKKFLKDLAFQESSGDPTCVNRIGCIGLFQFKYSARKATGYGYVLTKNFRENPMIWSTDDQYKAMDSLLALNHKHLRKIIDSVDKYPIIIDSTRITKSGVLAAAHLSGYRNVERFFKSGRNPRDIFGTHLKDYLLKYSGYEF